MDSQVIKALEPKAFVAEAKADPQAVVIDVRTPQEYAEGHLNGAKNINWLDPKAFAAGVARLPKDKTYLLYCRSGHRSLEAAVKMQQEGYHVADMTGGILNYEAQGLPVTRE